VKIAALITTTVPPSCTVAPVDCIPVTAIALIVGSYGSAKEACRTSGPSKKVDGRPQVLSTIWAGTAKWPGAHPVSSEPTAVVEMIRSTPRSCIADTLARYGTR
jgi:hypothetical protein